MPILQKILTKLQASYFRTRIIVTFSVVTILLGTIISVISYRFVRNIYLAQISEKVNLLSLYIGQSYTEGYLDLLALGRPTEHIRNYFLERPSRLIYKKRISEFVIFDRHFNVIIHSDRRIKPGNAEAIFLLNKKEILALKNHASVVSLPFKGDDGEWYMWGFYRLNNDYWFSIKESASRLQQVEKLALFFWITGLFGFLITVTSGWLIARLITRPVFSLINFCGEIGKGNLDYPLPSHIYGELGLLASALDIMRTDLRKNQKEKEKILAQIAHEIRNPLGGIELMVNLIREDFLSEKKDPVYIDKILKETTSLKSLITSYLSYSRPAPARPETIATGKILAEIKELFEKTCIKKNIELVIDNRMDQFRFDPMHLRQILINLINNSIEAIKDGPGSISIKAYAKDSTQCLSVSDSGALIDSSSSQKIFDPFYTTKKEGTGLGLAICRKLAFENNSDIVLQTGDNVKSFCIMKRNSDE